MLSVSDCMHAAELRNLTVSIIMSHIRCGCGAQIGTVFASKDYVAPMAVGVDIGAPLYW